jgi:hypothetical protein
MLWQATGFTMYACLYIVVILV